MPVGLISRRKARGSTKSALRQRRHFRVRKRVTGTTERPRLVVNRSSRHVVAQIVDDTSGRTLAWASTMEADVRAVAGDKTAKARKVGELIPTAETYQQIVSLIVGGGE